MVKLLIVEDEELARNQLVQQMDWQASGVQLIGAAENGIEAWEMVEKFSPDIMLADIRMPYMDGLKLSELVKMHYPETKIVLMSGYDQFEYAQKAVNLQIDGYLLKPFATNEVVEAIHRIKQRIDEETKLRSDYDSLQDHYHRSIPILRETFLVSMMSRRLKQQEIEEKALLYGLDLFYSSFVVGVIQIDQLTEEKIQPNTHLSLARSKDKELQLFAVYNIADEIIRKYSLGEVFPLGEHIVVLIRGCLETYSEDTVMKVFEEIRKNVERYLKFTVTIGVSNETTDLTALSESHKQALSAIDYRLMYGGNRVIYLADVEKRKADKVKFDEAQEMLLTRSIKLGDYDSLIEIIESLLAHFEGSHLSVNEFRIYLLHILNAILSASKDAGAEPDEFLGKDFASFFQLFTLQNLGQVREEILSICTRLMKHIAIERQKNNQTLVDKAKEYIYQHYEEEDLSLQRVCGYLHISIGYFSGIFKKETNTTFVNFLHSVRMQAAKEFLLMTNLKAYEISERVGFNDPNYFSYCFKKYVGISPKEFRNTNVKLECG